MVSQRRRQPRDRKLFEIAGHEDDEMRNSDLHRDGGSGQTLAGDRQGLAGRGTSGSRSVTFATGARARRSGPSRSRARDCLRNEAAPLRGVTRRAAGPVGAEGSRPAVRVEIVEVDPALGAAGRKRAPSAPTERPRRQSEATRRRSSSESLRPSASKTRKSLPPPAIFTKRVGSGKESASKRLRDRFRRRRAHVSGGIHRAHGVAVARAGFDRLVRQEAVLEGLLLRRAGAAVPSARKTA